MDYCHDPEASTWECARSIFLGVVALVTCLISLVAFERVLRAHLRRKAFALNLVMISLTILQTSLDFVDLIIKRESRLQLLSITLRSLQTNVAYTAYTSFILENRRASSRAFWCSILPLTCLSIATLVLFILACLEDEVACEHPLWLVMSVFQVTISLAFFATGLMASREARDQAHPQQHYFVSNEMASKTQALWLLMGTFLIASIAQLTGDAWRLDLARNGESCRYHDSHGEEFFRVVLFVMSFDVPAWGVLLVFFYLPRHSFDAAFDVELPSVQLLQWEDTGRRGSSDNDDDEEIRLPESEWIGLDRPRRQKEKRVYPANDEEAPPLDDPEELYDDGDVEDGNFE